MRTEQTRMAKCRDYDLMDAEFPELSSALNIYADNATHRRARIPALPE